jgi:hypothetical protein
VAEDAEVADTATVEVAAGRLRTNYSRRGSSVLIPVFFTRGLIGPRLVMDYERRIAMARTRNNSISPTLGFAKLARFGP